MHGDKNSVLVTLLWHHAFLSFLLLPVTLRSSKKSFSPYRWSTTAAIVVNWCMTRPRAGRITKCTPDLAHLIIAEGTSRRLFWLCGCENGGDGGGGSCKYWKWYLRKIDTVGQIDTEEPFYPNASERSERASIWVSYQLSVVNQSTPPTGKENFEF